MGGGAVCPGLPFRCCVRECMIKCGALARVVHAVHIIMRLAHLPTHGRVRAAELLLCV